VSHPVQFGSVQMVNYRCDKCARYYSVEDAIPEALRKCPGCTAESLGIEYRTRIDYGYRIEHLERSIERSKADRRAAAKRRRKAGGAK